MKYGEALPQRSVLEWLPFNLDYNDIRDLIKKRTLGRSPVADPGMKSDFEDELLKILMEQLERIELFVKSKSGEIDRRIVHCSKLVAILASKDNIITPKRLARYAKAENEIERAGQDIQNLSRFVNAQYTGFLKLLKKYRKWTGSATLSEQFLPILEAPTSFHNRDFEGHVLQMSELLGTVREKFNASVTASKTMSQSPTEIVPPLRTLPLLFDSDLPTPKTLKTHADLDMALGTNSNAAPWFPDGAGSKAVFWVHTDYLIEIQVLLLKYLNLKSLATPYPTAPPTPAVSRRASSTNLAGATAGYEKDEEVGSVIFDNLAKFALAQSSSTIEQTSETGPAAKARWCGTSKDAEASIIVGSTPGAQHSMKLKRKHVENTIDSSTALPIKDRREDANTVRNWFAENPDVKPLVKIEAKRTRFVSGDRVWAVLDKDIRMFKLGAKWRGCISDPSRIETGRSATFPHAVLEVRWDSHQEPPLVKELYQSHLVEAVHGFSLDVHAVYILHQPKEMSPPSWSHALSKDIRKTPMAHSRKDSLSRFLISSTGPSSSSTFFVGDQTDAIDSTGTFVATRQNSENISPTATKRLTWSKTKKVTPPTETGWLVGERYWSEFNDEEEEDEPYTILVSSGGTFESGDGDGILGKLVEKMKNLFSFTDEFEPQEGQQLLPEMADSSDEDVEGRPTQSGSRNYSTFPTHDHDFQSRVRERVLFRGYCLCYLASATILSIATAWAIGGSSSKHGSDFDTGLGEALCVSGSLVLAGYAVSLFVARKDNLGFLHKFMVYGLFCLICLCASFVLSIVYNNSLRP